MTTTQHKLTSRQDLIRHIATQTGLTQKVAGEALEATLDAIRESLGQGKEVRLVGFGSFKVRKTAARTATSPRDRTPIQVPAKDRVRFTPGKELSESVTSKG